jgi:hypothetical protein
MNGRRHHSLRGTQPTNPKIVSRIAMALVTWSSAATGSEPAAKTASMKVFWSRRGDADDRAPGKRMTFVAGGNLNTIYATLDPESEPRIAARA